MQIKTMMRYHFTSVRMTIIRKSTHSKCWQRYGEKQTLLHCLWECKFNAVIMENSMAVPQKAKNRMTV